MSELFGILAEKDSANVPVINCKTLRLRRAGATLVLFTTSPVPSTVPDGQKVFSE